MILSRIIDYCNALLQVSFPTTASIAAMVNNRHVSTRAKTNNAEEVVFITTL